MSTATTLNTTLEISSSEFRHQEHIPNRYTCEGDGINPPLAIQNIPEKAKSIVLIMEDPDAPGKIFDHWLVWNIPPKETIEEDSIPGKVGKNSRGKTGYTAPCPPSGTHRYFFKMYALDALLHLEDGADKKTITEALGDHVLAYGELIGLYKKQKQ
jgi:Raf kinase inhibitor-like YbhB/YbcL family protein